MWVAEIALQQSNVVSGEKSIIEITVTPCRFYKIIIPRMPTNSTDVIDVPIRGNKGMVELTASLSENQVDWIHEKKHLIRVSFVSTADGTECKIGQEYKSRAHKHKTSTTARQFMHKSSVKLQLVKQADYK